MPSNLEHEPVCFLDLTYSETYPIVPGSDTNRHTITMAAYKVFVRKLAELDDAASDHSMEGTADFAAHGGEGGLLTFGYQSEFVRQLGNVNPVNYEQKVANLRCGGNTRVMPAIAQWMTDRDEEFSQDQVLDKNREFDLLFLTDGALDDEDQFLAWVERAPANHKVFFVLIGQGDDNTRAAQDYQTLAKRHPGQVYLYSMQGQTDPEAIANEMIKIIS